MVFTVLVKGSAISSHTFSNSSSAVTARPWADNRYSSTANSFGLRTKLRPPRDATRREGSTLKSPFSSTGGSSDGDRRPSALYPSHELGEIEGFRQVIVGAQAKPVDPVPHRARPP